MVKCGEAFHSVSDAMIDWVRSRDRAWRHGIVSAAGTTDLAKPER